MLDNIEKLIKEARESEDFQLATLLNNVATDVSLIEANKYTIVQFKKAQTELRKIESNLRKNHLYKLAYEIDIIARDIESKIIRFEACDPIGAVLESYKILHKIAKVDDRSIDINSIASIAENDELTDQQIIEEIRKRTLGLPLNDKQDILYILEKDYGINLPLEKIALLDNDKIPGGRADDKKLDEFTKEQLEQIIKGIKVELEHTDDPEVALEIATDHVDEIDTYYDELNKMEKKLLAFCNKRAYIGFSHEYDIPYEANRSKNGDEVYLDKDIPLIMELKDGRRFSIVKYIKIHELSEKNFMDAGYHYEDAHKLATQLEKAAVEADGFPWDEYSAHLRGYAHSSNINLKQVPKNIDMRPYKDEHNPLVKKIKQKQAKVPEDKLIENPKSEEEKEHNRKYIEKTLKHYYSLPEEERKNFKLPTSFPSQPYMWGGFAFEAIVPYQQRNQLNYWSLASVTKQKMLNKIAKINR